MAPAYVAAPAGTGGSVGRPNTSTRASNRYGQISEKFRALCEKYDLLCTTGPLHQQYGQVLRVI